MSNLCSGYLIRKENAVVSIGLPFQLPWIGLLGIPFKKLSSKKEEILRWTAKKKEFFFRWTVK